MTNLTPTESTKIWLEEFVISLNLCPFAAAPFKRGDIRYRETVDLDLDKISVVVREEVRTILTKDADALSTTLIILSAGLADFLDFNEFLNTVDQILAEEQAVGIIQAASFHPLYLFEGEAPDSNSHYTNRSPYPLLHLLRESEIDRARDVYQGDIEEIPQNNIEKLNKLDGLSLQANLEKLRQGLH